MRTTTGANSGAQDSSTDAGAVALPSATRWARPSLGTDSGRLTATLSSGEEISLAAATRAILFQEPAHFPFSIRHTVTMRFERTPDGDYRIW